MLWKDLEEIVKLPHTNTEKVTYLIGGITGIIGGIIAGGEIAEFLGANGKFSEYGVRFCAGFFGFEFARIGLHKAGKYLRQLISKFIELKPYTLSVGAQEIEIPYELESFNYKPIELEKRVEGESIQQLRISLARKGYNTAIAIPFVDFTINELERHTAKQVLELGYDTMGIKGDDQIGELWNPFKDNPIIVEVRKRYEKVPLNALNRYDTMIENIQEKLEECFGSRYKIQTKRTAIGEGMGKKITIQCENKAPIVIHFPDLISRSDEWETKNNPYERPDKAIIIKHDTTTAPHVPLNDYLRIVQNVIDAISQEVNTRTGNRYKQKTMFVTQLVPSIRELFETAIDVVTFPRYCRNAVQRHLN